MISSEYLLLMRNDDVLDDELERYGVKAHYFILHDTAYRIVLLTLTYNTNCKGPLRQTEE